MSLSRSPFIVASISGMLVLGGCGSQPDYTPFGDGMKAIGISLVVVAVVGALAELIMAEGKRSKDRPERKTRNKRKTNSKGGET